MTTASEEKNPKLAKPMLRGTVAIVGRPNVGKSTLFNRLTRSQRAIVDDRPGVTRDRLLGTVAGGDDEDGFLLFDTGGFEAKGFHFQPFDEGLVWQQTQAAIDEADLVVLVMDGRAGPNPHDEVLLRTLEKLQKPYVVVVNKLDGMESHGEVWEFSAIGVTDPWPMSAAHNRGVWELADHVRERLADIHADRVGDTPDDATHIAIIGRPNAGKSSLVNRLVGEERSLVSDVAGTTRDVVDTTMKFRGNTFVLVDTAGIRRKSKVKDRLESLSVLRSVRAIERADVILMVIDASQGLTEQDARLADLAVSRHKPLLMVVNKWDLVDDKDSNSARDYAADLRHQIKGMAYIPVTFISCLTNQRVHRLLSAVEDLTAKANKRIPTAKLNETMHRIVYEHTPALIRNHTKRVKFFYVTQVRCHPPTFVVFCNVADEIMESYKRYMTNRFRQDLGFGEVPVRLIFRDKKHLRQKQQEQESSGVAVR